MLSGFLHLWASVLSKSNDEVFYVNSLI